MMNDKFDIIATTFFGLEGELKAELEAMGGSGVQPLTRAVIFRGNTEMLYRANLWCRTALKVLVPIMRFSAYNDRELYDFCFRIDWQRYMAVSDTFAIDCVASGPIFTHSKYAALKCKDAIADYFRQKRGRRPDVDVEYPDLRINVHIFNSDVTISLDSTGVPMSKRGYKARQTAAPLNEVMAAGILRLAKWDMRTPLLDPMCGSGTFLTEACLMAMNIAPGGFRHFALEKWRDFDRDLWARLKQEAKDARLAMPTAQIAGYDRDPMALDIASQNIRQLGLDDMINLDRSDFFSSQERLSGKFIVMNPPYGERLEDAERMAEFYKSIGNALKSRCSGCQAWVLGGNLEAIKQLGLHPSAKIKLFNGPIECRLERFDIYDGSRKKSF